MNDAWSNFQKNPNVKDFDKMINEMAKENPELKKYAEKLKKERGLM